VRSSISAFFWMTRTGCGSWRRECCRELIEKPLDAIKRGAPLPGLDGGFDLVIHAVAERFVERLQIMPDAHRQLLAIGMRGKAVEKFCDRFQCFRIFGAGSNSSAFRRSCSTHPLAGDAGIVELMTARLDIAIPRMQRFQQMQQGIGLFPVLVVDEPGRFFQARDFRRASTCLRRFCRWPSSSIDTSFISSSSLTMCSRCIRLTGAGGRSWLRFGNGFQGSHGLLGLRLSLGDHGGQRRLQFADGGQQADGHGGTVTRWPLGDDQAGHSFQQCRQRDPATSVMVAGVTDRGC